MTRILVIDNYDSFVYNIVQYLAQLGAKVDVKRNDEVTVEQAREYDGVLLSPGPGTQTDAGVCIDIVKELGGQVPTSQVFHHKQGVLADLPSPFTATRYHSLAVERDSVSAVLEVTSETEDGVIMSLRHKEFDIEGVQFHPESVLTEGGHKMLAEWLVRCGDLDARNLAQGLQPVIPI